MPTGPRAPRTDRRDPPVVVCAWCSRFRPHAALVRPAAEPRWTAASPAFARALTAGRLASHGICPACVRDVLRP